MPLYYLFYLLEQKFALELLTFTTVKKIFMPQWTCLDLFAYLFYHILIKKKKYMPLYYLLPILTFRAKVFCA